MGATFTVQQEDITKVPSDLLLLKYAKGFHGADLEVANLLIGQGVCTEKDIRPRPDNFAIIETKNAIVPLQAMFLGAPGLSDFHYGRMRHFATRAIEVLAIEKRSVKTITTTVHGVNYGLDASESLQSLVRGFQDGLALYGDCGIKRIVFVERRERTARILTAALESLHLKSSPEGKPAETKAPVQNKPTEDGKPPAPVPGQIREVEILDSPKKHVFVAMPFSEEFQDTYEFGIYGPVRRCGFICEKVDESLFTGDILQRILQRIATAEFVIADLTGARANVYLEMGYAWGKNVPVIALARDGEKLHFDVVTHRCIFYRTIGQLSRELERLIRGLYDSTPDRSV